MWKCRTLVLRFLATFLFAIVVTGKGPASDLFNKLSDDNNKPFTLCVLEKRNNYNIKGRCSLLKKINAPFQCVFAIDRLECLRKLSAQKADFAVFQPEELLVASTHRNLDSVLIVSEFQYFSTFKKNYYSMSVVVRNDVNISSFQDLRGKRLCHPGAGPDGGDHGDIFTQFFEDRIVEQKCDPFRTVTENRVKSLADYFGPSCKAGPWALDPVLDTALKTKYSNLCEQCDNIGSTKVDDCNYRNPYSRNPLLCLSDCAGDFAWGHVSEIQKHFKRSTSFLQDKNERCDDVSYMCPDGTFQNIFTPNPCVWIERPNAVVAAHSSIAADVQNFIDKVLISQSEGDKYRLTLSSLLESPPRFALTDLITPFDYLKQAEGFLSSSIASKCGKDREIKLCATSVAEKNQCNWLSAAAASYGIEPSISCYEPTDNNCYSAVQNDQADVFLTNSDQLLPARRDYKLTPLLYETITNKNCKYFSILVDTNSNINKLEDLRGKKACFTAVDGVGWTSLIMELQKAFLLPDDCPQISALASFFDEICISGPINSSITDRYKNIRYCNSELSDDYDKQSGIEREAVDCILSGGGDVAFVAVDSVSRYAELNGYLSNTSVKQLVGSRFKWLCGESGVQEKPCLLTKSTMGQVLVRQNISYIRREDIISTFKNLDSLFGGANKKGKQIFTFDMMAEFESSSEILFQDLGDRLELNNIYLEKHKLEKRSYENEIGNLVHCQSSLPISSAQMVHSFHQRHLFISFVSSFMLLHFSKVIQLIYY